MTPLAGLLLERGRPRPRLGRPLYPPMSDRLATLGIDVRPACGPGEPATPDVTRVVVGNLARADNPELLEAVRRGLPTASMPETLRTEILAGPASGRRRRYAREDDDDGARGVAPRLGRTRSRLSRRRRAPQLRRARPPRNRTGVRPRGRRVLDVVRRQGPEVPPLRTQDARPHLRRVRPRRPLPRSLCGQGGVPERGRARPPGRPHRRLRRRRERGGRPSRGPGSGHALLARESWRRPRRQRGRRVGGRTLASRFSLRRVLLSTRASSVGTA